MHWTCVVALMLCLQIVALELAASGIMPGLVKVKIIWSLLNVNNHQTPAMWILKVWMFESIYMQICKNMKIGKFEHLHVSKCDSVKM